MIHNVKGVALDEIPNINPLSIFSFGETRDDIPIPVETPRIGRTIDGTSEKLVLEFQNELSNAHRQQILTELKGGCNINSECLFYEVEKLVGNMQLAVRERDLELQRTIMQCEMDR